MLKVLFGLVVLALLAYCVAQLVKSHKHDSKISKAKDRLQDIENEHTVLDIEEDVQEAEDKLAERKNPTSTPADEAE